MPVRNPLLDVSGTARGRALYEQEAEVQRISEEAAAYGLREKNWKRWRELRREAVGPVLHRHMLPWGGRFSLDKPLKP